MVPAILQQRRRYSATEVPELMSCEGRHHRGGERLLARETSFREGQQVVFPRIISCRVTGTREKKTRGVYYTRVYASRTLFRVACIDVRSETIHCFITTVAVNIVTSKT